MARELGYPQPSQQGMEPRARSEFSMHAVARKSFPGCCPGDPWQHSGSTHRIALMLTFFLGLRLEIALHAHRRRRYSAAPCGRTET